MSKSKSKSESKSKIESEWKEKFYTHNCGNCYNDCCCKCLNDHCFDCKRDLKKHLHRPCSTLYVKNHIACFKCRIIKKVSVFDYESKKERYKNNHENICTNCNNVMKIVSSNLRFPKKNNIKGWDLIFKILQIKNPNIENSLFSHINKFTIFETNHMNRKIRSLFSYPKKHSEFNDFVEQLNKVVKV
jgi:hypothetical protein